MRHLFILCSVILNFVSSPLQAQVPTNGLVGEWKFNGNANDGSGSNNNGTVNGATLTVDRCGIPNSAYWFDGVDDNIVMLAAGPTGTVSRSVSFWAKTTNSVINNPRSAFHYGTSTGTGDAYQVVWNYCAAGVGLDLSNQALIRGNNCLMNNAWHHIAIVYDATVSTVYSSVLFYIDGVLQPNIVCNVSGTNAVISTGNAAPVIIGSGATANGIPLYSRYWAGSLDDFYLYNRAITPAEVLQLYNESPCTPPVYGGPVPCGGSATYSIEPIANAVYTWSLSSGWTGSSSSNVISVGGGAPSGTITVTYTSSVCGFSGTASSTLGLGGAGTVSLNPPGQSYTVSCAQPTIFLDATPSAYNYTWTNGVLAPLSGTTTGYNQFSAGNWVVTGFDPLTGCAGSRTFTIYVDQVPPTSVVSPVNQNVTCGPGSVVTATGTAISPTTNVTHAWYSPTSVFPAQGGGQYSLYGLTGGPGTYTYVLTNNVNGCSTTKTIQITSNLGFPTFGLSSLANFTLGCSTKSITDAHIVNPNTTPLSGGSMSFAVLPPGFSQPSYTFSSVLDYTFTTPGNYTFIVQDVNNLCETQIVMPVIQDVFQPNALVNASTRTLTCRTPSTVLQGVSTTTPVTYSWSFQNGSNPNSVPNATTTVQSTTNTAISATVVNIYTLTVTNTNNLCKTTTLVPIYQNIRAPRPKINGAGPLDCITFEQTLVNGSTLDEAPGFFAPLGTAVTKWEGPSPQVDNTDTVASYKAKTVGLYTMTVMDRNNGCITQTTVLVADNSVYPVLQTNSIVPLDCGATTSGVNLSVTAVGLKASDVTALWTTPLPTPDIKNANTLTLTTNGVGEYTLAVTTNSNGCRSNIRVKVTSGLLTGDFVPDRDSGFAPLTVNFTNNSSSTSSITGTSGITSVWSFGNGTTLTTTTNVTTSALYNQPGSYTVTLFSSKGGCMDTVIKVIYVDIPSKLEIPNIFTPNGDNSNDVFFIKSANLVEIKALIYDRWGNKVYELTTDRGNIAWDGKNLTGNDSPDGTYLYIITANGKDGQTYDAKGTVTLLR